MKYFFSAINLAAYPDELLAIYQEAGTLPSDLVELTQQEYQQYFIDAAPTNTKLAATDDGKPCFLENLNAQELYESQLTQVESTRRALYTNVDALRNEAAMIRLVEADEAKAADYEAQAMALYMKIRDDNPWPVPPTN